MQLFERREKPQSTANLFLMDASLRPVKEKIQLVVKYAAGGGGGGNLLQCIAGSKKSITLTTHTNIRGWLLYRCSCVVSFLVFGKFTVLFSPSSSFVHCGKTQLHPTGKAKWTLTAANRIMTKIAD